MIQFEAVTGYNPNMPQRQTEFSAGYDIEILKGDTINPKETKVFLTGLKAQMNSNVVLQLHIRSSMGIKNNLMLSNTTGIIDADYYNNPDNEGHIMIALTNYGDKPVTLKDNERVAQGIFVEYLKTTYDNPKGKRTGGIGSTAS